MTGLKPKGVARERILALGGAKVGKTSAYLSIAKKCPESTVHVLDSDFAMDRMLEGGDFPNVEVTTVDGWVDYVEGVKAVCAKAKPDDWLVIDFLSGAWDAVQTWYIDKRYGMAPEDYFTKHELANKKGNALEGDTDWGVINKNHKALMSLIKRAPCHVFATATSRTVGDRDDAGLKSTFGAVGSRPEGQKHLSHDFHTLVLFKKSRLGEFQMTTVGDRQRTLVENVPVKEFATDYLLKVAGWRP